MVRNNDFQITYVESNVNIAEFLHGNFAVLFSLDFISHSEVFWLMTISELDFAQHVLDFFKDDLEMQC